MTSSRTSQWSQTLPTRVVPNFVITPEIAYVDNFNDDFDDVFDDDDDVVDENWGFFIRAQANFGG